MLILIENGEVYTPDPIGRASVLVSDRVIASVGEVNRHALEQTELEVLVIDASGGVVTPGFIDPHEHLLGGSGERGFSTQSPEIFWQEIVRAGITTVVGVLGVDTTMKTLAGLLARVKGLKGEGLTAYMWSGGYNVPPTSITQSIRNDLMFIEEVIGAGEIAIADRRGLCPQAPELARVVLDTHVGGMLSGKAGLTHFHVGEHPQGLDRLRELLDDSFAVEARMLYPTHVARTETLLDEAIALVAQGAAADIDTVEGDLGRWARRWFENGGDPARLTISSDAGSSSPGNHLQTWRRAILEHGLPLELMLALATRNPADVLGLNDKGRLEPGKDADILVFERGSLELRHVIARGRHLLADGALTRGEAFLADSDRHVELQGHA